MTERVIDIRGLHKSYGDVEAVAGVDLHVDQGEVFALLGPNGAGKTTTVEILEGYRDRTAGDISVLGHDPAKPDADLKRRIGIVLQSTGVDPYLTVRETVTLYAGFYPSPRDVDEVVDLVGLAEKRDTRVNKLSGGQQRRLDVAVALAGDPELLFLDEPTTGFDPNARRNAWEIVKNLTVDRQDDLPDDPLHGRGPVPRGPGRRDRRRFDRRGGPPGHPGGARSHADASSVPTSPRVDAAPPGLSDATVARRRLDRDPDREPDEGRCTSSRPGHSSTTTSSIRWRSRNRAWRTSTSS